MGGHIQPEFFDVFVFFPPSLSLWSTRDVKTGQPNAPISWLLGAGRRADSSLEAGGQPEPRKHMETRETT